MIRDAKNMTLLGPKVSRVQGFVVYGQMAKCKQVAISSRNLLSFLSDASWVVFKKGAQGASFTVRMRFRTFKLGATFIFHQLDPNDVERHLWVRTTSVVCLLVMHRNRVSGQILCFANH